MLIGVGIIAATAAAFAIGFFTGQAHQFRKCSEGNLAFSLHYLALLQTNDLERLARDLKFVTYAEFDWQSRSRGDSATNGMSVGQLARWQKASAIHSEMATQVVTVTPQKLMDAFNAQMRTNSSVK